MLNETQMERTGEEGKPIMMTAKGKGRDRRGVGGELSFNVFVCPGLVSYLKSLKEIPYFTKHIKILSFMTRYPCVLRKGEE